MLCKSSPSVLGMGSEHVSVHAAPIPQTTFQVALAALRRTGPLGQAISMRWRIAIHRALIDVRHSIQINGLDPPLEYDAFYDTI